MMTVTQTTGRGTVPDSAAFWTSQEALNRLVVRRLYEQVASQQNLAAIDDVVATDVQVHSPIANLEPGRNGLHHLVEVYMQQFPERHLELHDLIAAGDRVVVRYTLHGADHAELTTPAAAGGTREATLNGMAIARLVDQRIVEIWHQDDLPQLHGTNVSR